MTADVGKALRTKLLSDSGIATLIGQRMYTDALKVKSDMPAIVYYKISTLRDHTIGDVTALAHSRIQFDCYGLSRDTANEVSHAVRKSGIAGYTGITDSINFTGIEFDTGDQYSQEPPTDGNQVHRYITTFDLMVHYQEAD